MTARYEIIEAWETTGRPALIRISAKLIARYLNECHPSERELVIERAHADGSADEDAIMIRLPIGPVYVGPK